MSAAESEFVWVENPEDVRAPTADRFVNPADRVEGFAYKCGVIELRSAQPAEYLNSTHGIINVRDHR